MSSFFDDRDETMRSEAPDETNTPLEAGRFFRSLVLMGGSLALGCGGDVYEVVLSSGGSSGAEAGGGMSGEAQSGGASSGGAENGGAASGGLALSTGGGGSGGSLPGAGGSSLGGMGGELFACETTQLECLGVSPLPQSDCTFDLRAGCVCSGRTPAGPEDCPEGWALVCARGVMGSFESEEDVVPFGCECRPMMDDERMCSMCGQAGSTCSIEDSVDGTTVLCGCEVTLLR